MSDPSDPIRLLSDRSELMAELDRELLLSAREDHAPLHAEERALASLGLGVVALTVAASSPALLGTTTATTTAASFAPSSLLSSTPTALKITGLAFVKWVGVGVVAVAAAAGTYKVVASTHTESARTETGRTETGRTESARMASARMASAPPPFAPRSNVARVSDPGATTESPAQAPDQSDQPAKDEPRSLSVAMPSPGSTAAAASGAGPSATPAQGAGQLAGELALLDRARGALAQRDPAAATAALDEYARKYPSGTMREEATVARIEALLLAGQSALAATQAEQFLREHPASTNTKRVRQLRKRATAEN